MAGLSLRAILLLLFFLTIPAVAQTTISTSVAFELLDYNTFIFVEEPVDSASIEVCGDRVDFFSIDGQAFGLSALDANLTILQVDNLTVGVELQGAVGYARYYHFNKTAPRIFIEPPFQMIDRYYEDYDEFLTASAPAAFKGDGFVEVKAEDGTKVYFTYTPAESFVPEYQAPFLIFAVPIAFAIVLVLLRLKEE